MANRSGLGKIIALAVAATWHTSIWSRSEESGAPADRRLSGRPARRWPHTPCVPRTAGPLWRKTGQERPGQRQLVRRQLLCVARRLRQHEPGRLLGGQGQDRGRPQRRSVRFAASVPADANLGLAVFESRGIGELLPLGMGNRQTFNQAVAQVRVRRRYAAALRHRTRLRETAGAGAPPARLRGVPLGGGHRRYRERGRGPHGRGQSDAGRVAGAC